MDKLEEQIEQAPTVQKMIKFITDEDCKVCILLEDGRMSTITGAYYTTLLDKPVLCIFSATSYPLENK